MAFCGRPVRQHQPCREGHYIDGYFASSYTDLQSLPDNPIPLIIGDENNHLYAFDGVIDDVRLYNRVLSEAEIWTLKYSDR